MKIYATGFNPADSNALKRNPRVAIFQAVVPMMEALRENGEELVWRATKVGDDLPHDTDAVIVSVMLPRSLNCPYALGATWAISEALRREIPLVLYMTDWAFFKTAGEYKSIYKQGQSYFSKKIGGALQYNESSTQIERCGLTLLEICRQWNDPTSLLWGRAQILVPRYTNWGDVSIVQRMLPAGANPVFSMDPTLAFLRYLEGGLLADIRSMSERTRAWILPSLLKDDTWLEKQNLQWPILRYGPKGFPVLPDERSIQNEYRFAVGAICHPYPHAGSGWWRSRWIHAALAKSILLCNPIDGQAVGGEYGYRGFYYERQADTTLAYLARKQSERMRELLQTDYEVFVEQVYAPLRKAGV